MASTDRARTAPAAQPPDAARRGLSALLDNRKVPTVILGDVRAHVLRAARDENGRDHTVLHPSAICKPDWCPRAAYRELLGAVSPPETPSFRRQTVFQYGHDAHARWQRWLAQLGLLEGDWRCNACHTRFYAGGPLSCDCGNQELTYQELALRDEQLMIEGRTDGYIPRHKALLEIKTVGEGTVRMEAPDLLERHTVDTGRGRVVDVKSLWSDLHRPFTSHLRQGQIYLHCARKMGLNVEKIIFIYDAKSDQDAKEFTVPYNPGVIRRVLLGAQQVASAMRNEGPIPTCRARGAACTACAAMTEAP